MKEDLSSQKGNPDLPPPERKTLLPLPLPGKETLSAHKYSTRES
jgi:hypothetical protein